MDNLDRDSILCEQAGFGVSYGKWRAAQPVKQLPKPTPQKPNKKCKHCGAGFLSDKSTRIYCSDECRNQAYYEKKYPKRKPREIKCEYCGKEIIAHSSARRFCSRRCVYLARYYPKSKPTERD